MIDRNKVVVGLLAILAVVSAVGFGLMVSRLGDDGCMSGSGSASCPTLADVNGVRYTVSIGQAFKNIEPDLSPYAAISRTNAPDRFAEMQAYSVAGFDPAVLLITRTTVGAGDEGPYRMLTVVGRERSSIWPAFCDYLPEERLLAQPECGAPA